MKIDLDRAKTPEERKAAEAILAKVNESLRRNPLEKWNNPDLGLVHHKQMRFAESKAWAKAFLGGNGAGKTFAGAPDNIVQAIDAAAVPEHLKHIKKFDPPFRLRVCAPKFNENHEGVIFPTLREWIPKDQLEGGSWDKAFSKQRRILNFKNGSWFQFLTYEQDLDAFSGAAVDRVWYDEEPEGEKGRQIHNENLMRIMRTGGDWMITMTPLFGMSWVYDEVWEQRGNEVEKDTWEGDDGNLFIVTVDMDDNPWLSEKSKAQALKRFSKSELQARKEGKFVHFGGLVYEEFDPDKHLVDPPRQDHLKGQDIYVGIDPGVNTTAVAFCSFDADNAMLVFDELYLHDDDAIPDNAARHIKDKLSYWGLALSDPYYVMDPTFRHRQLATGREDIQQAYERAGIYPIPGQNAIEAGVFELKRRFDHGALFISRGCHNWRNEIKRYRREQTEDGTFKTVRGADHLMDASRYVAQERPWFVASHPDPEVRRWQPGYAPPAEWLNAPAAPPSTSVGNLT